MMKLPRPKLGVTSPDEPDEVYCNRCGRGILQSEDPHICPWCGQLDYTNDNGMKLIQKTATSDPHRNSSASAT